MCIRDSHLGVQELWGALLGFGVCTPGTVQRTTLEEDVRPDAGSIMGRKALDIKNHRLELTVFSLHHLFLPDQGC